MWTTEKIVRKQCSTTTTSMQALGSFEMSKNYELTLIFRILKEERVRSIKNYF